MGFRRADANDATPTRNPVVANADVVIARREVLTSLISQVNVVAAARVGVNPGSREGNGAKSPVRWRASASTQNSVFVKRSEVACVMSA
jgi:hypothetical protein